MKTKEELIAAIIAEYKNACTLQDKPFDGASMLFRLAFVSEANIKKIAKGLDISHTKEIPPLAIVPK